MKLVLLGAPAAGKGTQANLMVDKFNLHHVSTGDLLRAEIAKGTELGLLAKSLIDKGNFVDDSIVEQMIENEIENRSVLLAYLKYTGVFTEDKITENKRIL